MLQESFIVASRCLLSCNMECIPVHMMNMSQQILYIVIIFLKNGFLVYKVH